MEEEGELWTNLEKTAHFIFYLVYFNKDFYVAFTAKVQFFFKLLPKNARQRNGMSRLFQLSFPDLKTTSEKIMLIVTLLWLP